jgi:drug/metabolite transporter (DMT)-like permease
VETVARLAVLLSCAAAGGTLLVLLARPRSASPSARTAQPGMLPGVLAAALAAFVLLAGGVALTGAGRLDAGTLATGLRVGGVALLVATAFLAVLVVAPHGERIPMTLGGLVVLLWAGAALALVSWLLAIGAVLIALIGGVRIEPHR